MAPYQQVLIRSRSWIAPAPFSPNAAGIIWRKEAGIPVVSKEAIFVMGQSDVVLVDQRIHEVVVVPDHHASSIT